MQKQLRIIAGKLRGRKIFFDDDNLALRPTLDRVRETLFNWLSGYIEGAYCLDLFAGSGAFSFEAISRGAKHVVAVEHNCKTSNNIINNQYKFNIHGEFLHIINQNVLSFLNQPWHARKFDIVFLDPPYKAQDLLLISIKKLLHNNFLQPGAKIYCEIDQKEQQFIESINLLGLHIKKASKAGKVYFYLYEYKI